MNWPRAKTILIIALIITNVFLVITYGDFNFRADEFRDHKALSEFLAQKNIFVDAEIIPKENRDMPVLFVQKLEIDREQINRALSSQGVSAEQAKVIFKSVIDGMAIEKSHITLFFEDGIPVYIECEWLEALNVHNRKQPTISAAQALLLFLAQIEQTRTILITGIEMIYWLDETIMDIETAGSVDTAFPTWKITYKEASYDRVMYIHAYKQ